MKTCAICASPLVRRADEPSGNFSKRKTCGRACQLALRAVAQTARRQQTVATLPDRHCLNCGKLLVPHAEESLENFKRRVTCDLACGYERRGKLRSTPPPLDPRCIVCGSPLVRRAHEMAGQFAKRKTCSLPCQHAATGRANTRRTDQGTKKQCAACGAWFGPGQLSAQNFARQQTCSAACSGALRRMPGTNAERTCATCGQLLIQRAAESGPAFLKRKTCGSAPCKSLLAQRKVDYHGVILPIKVVAEIEGVTLATMHWRLKADKIPGATLVDEPQPPPQPLLTGRDKNESDVKDQDQEHPLKLERRRSTRLRQLRR